MASQVTNYPGPACTGPLNFDPEAGKVSCDFCGSSFELAETESMSLKSIEQNHILKNAIILIYYKLMENFSEEKIDKNRGQKG